MYNTIISVIWVLLMKEFLYFSENNYLSIFLRIDIFFHN